MSTSTTHYVSWQQGATILGVGHSQFFNLARQYRIATEPGASRSGRRYSEHQLQQVAATRKTTRRRRWPKARKPEQLFLDWLQPSDIPAILNLDLEVYHQMYIAEAAVYQGWSEKNGQLAMCAFDPKSDRRTMWGYIACLPLAESVLLSILRKEREEISITQEEIQTYEAKGPYTLLCNSVVAHPQHPRVLRHVLRAMVASWVERFPERYVSRIYMQSVSPEGDMLVRNYYPLLLYDLADNAYMLDLARPQFNHELRHFQQALKAKDAEAYHTYYEQASFFSE